MAVVGYAYGWVWKRAVTRGGPWSSQYVIISALSIYLVMQTGEAVIFRTILLSVPSWAAWKWAMLPAEPVFRRRKALGRTAEVHDELTALEPWKGTSNG